MTLPQAVALAVLVGVVAALIWGKFRSDIVALTGAAVLLGTRTVRPVEVEGAFASPAIIALASLFVIAYAMELSGLLGWVVGRAIKLCTRLGEMGIWIVIACCGAASGFLNNTPIVVLAAPVAFLAARHRGRKNPAGLTDPPNRFRELVVHLRLQRVAEVEVVRHRPRDRARTDQVASRLGHRDLSAAEGVEVGISTIAVDGGGDGFRRSA